ncbi:MAG TPA: Uma2 family endonuclease [Blastocatellia bacterium]|jgi:Uma2 family endonuclease
MSAAIEMAVEPTTVSQAITTLDPDKSYEIVSGKPEEKEMPGAAHGVISARITIKLGIYLESNKIGEVFGETNFHIGNNQRIPDVAFVAAENIPAEGIPETAWPMPPDLAIEVISPNDLHEKVSDKILEYLEAGVRQVWLVSPKHRSLTIFRSQTDVKVFAGDSELVSEDLLPGFRCGLREIFPAIQISRDPEE